MPSLIDLRRRIRSIKNTQQITKAMKMVSAAKLRRAQQSVVNARPYATLLGDMLGSILSQAGDDSAGGHHPLLAKREVKRVLLLFLAGDKGLCSAFNTNVIKASTRFIADQDGKEVELELLGRKAVDYYSRPLVSNHRKMGSRLQERRVCDRARDRGQGDEALQRWRR